MATLTVRSTPINGTGDVTFSSAATAGDVFVNDGKTYFAIVNGSGGVLTVTFATPQTVAGLAVADGAVTVGTGNTAISGPFPTGTFNNSSGQVAVTYSSVTSVTVAAFN